MSNDLILLFNINLSILISFIGFKIFIFFRDKSIESFDKKTLLSITRLLFIASIAFPIIISNLNLKEEIPSLNHSTFKVFSEIGSGSSLEISHPKLGPINREVSDQKPKALINYRIQLALIFFIGFLFALFRLIRQIWSLHSLIKNSALHKRVGSYRLYYSHLTKAPFTFLSLSGPTVVLPTNIISDVPTVFMALQHENQHIRQRDIHWAFFIEILKVFFWFNLGIYLWSRLLKDISEISCDEQVLIRKHVKLKDYGNCLINVATSSFESFGITAGMAYSHNSNNSFLLRRIEMLKNTSNNGSVSIKLLTKTASLLTALVSLTLLTRVQASFSKVTTHPQVQKIVEKILEDGIRKAKAKTGFAIVADPNSGEIMAVSRIQIKNGKTEKTFGESFLNETYEPYSHIKPMIAAIALEHGDMHENTMLNAKGGKVKVHDKYFYDWKDHGDISFIDSVAHSSFVGVYRIAEATGEEKLTKGLKSFGFDGSNRLDKLSFAKSGRINLATGKNEKYNLAYLSNGTGNIQTSPLEMVQAYSAIANGGKLIQPRGYSDNNSKAEIIRKSISKETAERMKYILLRTMTQGTGKWAQSSKYTIAGKTATGYITEPKRSKDIYHQANRGLFIGFAPFKNPKLVSLVIIDEPEGAAHGSKHAAPVARSILNKSLTELEVKSDRGVSAN